MDKYVSEGEGRVHWEFNWVRSGELTRIKRAFQHNFRHSLLKPSFIMGVFNVLYIPTTPHVQQYLISAASYWHEYLQNKSEVKSPLVSTLVWRPWLTYHGFYSVLWSRKTFKTFRATGPVREVCWKGFCSAKDAEWIFKCFLFNLLFIF